MSLTPEPQQHWSALKELGVCGCGCGAYGTLKRAWSNGQRCVARKCRCPRCRGKVNRAKGDRAARSMRKGMGIGGANTRHEELWGGPIRVEAKAGKQVDPITTRYLAAKAQSEKARPIGDNREFGLLSKSDGGPKLVTFEVDRMEQVVAAYVEHYGWIT